MTPDANKITIFDNLQQIYQFIDEIIVTPKRSLKKWATITNQTPAAKIGYIGQHLASLITGVPGTGSGARGDDLADGSEVKSCNKIDQADKCKDCGARVMRFEETCPECGSSKIDRKDDSKWLFSIRDEHELNQYLTMDRVVLILMDYPGFKQQDYKDMRITCYEIYPKEERMKVFGELITNHYYNIYLPKLTKNEKTNPMNLHPTLIQFYKCNPIKTFSCIIKDIDTNPVIQIDDASYVDPFAARDSTLKPIPMPSTLLKKNEWDILLDSADYENELLPLLTIGISEDLLRCVPYKQLPTYLPYLDEKLRNYIPLRDIVSTRQQDHYQRR